MDLENQTNQDLLARTENLVQQERRITTEILWHLHEIERRMLFAELGFPSLFEYCTQTLKYSAGSAHRRIASMRLLKQIPELESRINSGALNVTALAQAQSVFRQAKIENKAFTLEAKKELLQKLEGKSSRDCEKVIAEISPVAHRPSTERVLAAGRTEIRFEIDDALHAKLKLLQGKFAHRLRGSNDFADLVEILADRELAKAESASMRKPEKSVPALEVKNPKSRYIPIAIKNAALARSQNRCTYTDPKNQRHCDSRFALEFDHIRPLALGGLANASNIRVLCRTHNQLAALKAFGALKMNRYLKRD